MCADEGPMNKQRVAAMRDAAKTLREKVNQNYETTAELMKEVLTLVDYEPFPVNQHLVRNFPLPLPPPLTRFASSSSSAAFPATAYHVSRSDGAKGNDAICDDGSDQNRNTIGSDSGTSPLSASSPVQSASRPSDLPDPESLCPGMAWSDGIEECVSDFRGRYLVAERDLSPGETIFVEKGFVTVITDKQSKVFCESCQSCPEASITFIKCSSCKSVVWCSNSCREKSMREFHEYECPTKLQLSPLKTDHFYLAMRMVIRGWDNALHKYLKGVSIGESIGMADEFSLMENRGKLSFEKTIDAAVMTKVFLWVLKSTGFVQGLQGQIALKGSEMAPHPSEYESLDHFLATTILSHWIRIQCNAFQHNFLQVIQQNPNHYRKQVEIEPYKPLGFGVMVSLKIAQMNHSCRPNCDYYFIGDLHIIRTIDFIKKGEEIFITYERLARSMVEKEDRSLHVAKNYGFGCFCTHCNTPGLDLCELYALENVADAQEKAEIEEQMDEAAILMRHTQVEEALQLLFRLKQLCAEKSMFWTASEIDERIDDCFGLKGTKIFVVF